MNTIMFYLGALALFGLSTVLIGETSPYSRSVGPTFERKRKRRLVGQIVLVMATLSLGIGVLAQFVSSNP
jgi:hypothetical protein